MSNFLGIDPARKTCAICLKANNEYFTWLYDLSNMAPGAIVGILDDIIDDIEISEVTIERFVSFKGIQVSASEDILMIIGSIQAWAYYRGIPINMFRSGEWKVKLSKHLFKKGFRNPSGSLDKEYSKAAAYFITGKHFNTDHEADAACLTYMATL